MGVLYDDHGVVLHHDRWEHVVGSIDGEADVAIIDPPYGDTGLPWDVLTTDWLAGVDRACKPTASLWVWGSMRMLLTVGAQITAAGWSFSQDIVWEKHNGSSSAADRFRRVHEQAVLFYRGQWADVHHVPQFTDDATKRVVRRKQMPAHWGAIAGAHYVSEDGGPRLQRSVVFERSAHGSAIHPTQKPLGITRTLLAYSCPCDGLTVDLFAGSGTTLMAARELGRRCVGAEQHEGYARAAADRLHSTLPLVAS